ncbi:MAG: hypothetical protein IJ877_04035 [Candidatus Gastranaerophilales bacterium]|nr:hypothetical protein [bacterium]MBR2068912.1 hypothetical protein [Candidatus Gastranaerophilales bacterium]
MTDARTGKTLDTSHCNYNAPLSAVATFADNSTLTKAMYGIDNATLSETQIKAIFDSSWNFALKYCK